MFDLLKKKLFSSVAVTFYTGEVRFLSSLPAFGAVPIFHFRCSNRCVVEVMVFNLPLSTALC